MRATRREFLKTAAVTSAGLALPGFALGEGLEHEGVNAALETEVLLDHSTRGIGIYPGDPAEYFGPTLIPAGTEYRNLALHRPAYHSSSYDYNLTAQLITDGLQSTVGPEWASVTVDDRVLARDEREVIFDHSMVTRLELSGTVKLIDIELGGGQARPAVDRIGLFVLVPETVKLAALKFSIYASPDARYWELCGTVGAPKPAAPKGYADPFWKGWHSLAPVIRFARQEQARFYRVELSLETVEPHSPKMEWRLAQVEFYGKDRRLEAGGPYHFTSAWKSAGLGTEWVYVDLGTACTMDRVKLAWIAPAAQGVLQISDDARIWRDLQPLPAAAAQQDIALSRPARGRYVRVWMTRPASTDGYVLSELEVYGRGGLIPRQKIAAVPDSEGRLELAGGAWRLFRADGAGLKGEELSQSGETIEGGIVATVPGTVLTSYLNAGAIPDPNFGENQLYLSDSYFYSDFWYTIEFTAPPAASGARRWLEFAGINWKAEVFLNGEHLGRMEGGFRRGRFDVTGRMIAGRKYRLAVRIEKNATPGSVKQKSFENVGANGGALGADNPTYHASLGWDWIPTIRGRNIGIWGAVTLFSTGVVTVEDPSCTTTLPLPDTSSALIFLTADVVNHSDSIVRGEVHGRLGEIVFAQSITLQPKERRLISFDPMTHPQLKLVHPQLWWPAGYGNPHLYSAEMFFQDENKSVSHRIRFKVGVRQIIATEDGGALRLYVNGRRIVPKGGNWGFSESMLRYGAREYDVAVRYHREMNFNIIRNWVGQIGDDALYEACDRHGLLVWQDFWLANPYDGPEPDNNALFLDNARDLVRRIRSHACLALYCGRNEGDPPPALDHGLRSLLAELHPAAHYISSSADGVVSGRGPYHALLPDAYFRSEDPLLHSEIGAPAIPSLESVQAMMPAASLWPQGMDWGLHDFCLHGAQGGASFLSLIAENYGGADSVKEWIELAQFLNYDTYRAMFESQSQHRMGVLLWMSHPCWPSFVWQTYDHYFEPTSAYFGCKKAAEPLHIQWNSATEEVEVVNSSAGLQRGLTARAEILDPHGKSLWQQSANLEAAEDSVASPIPMHYPADLPEVHLVRLTLMQGEKVISTNIYLRGTEKGNHRAIRTWGYATVEVSTQVERQQGSWRLTTRVHNTSEWPALMLRLKAVRAVSQDRILPAIYGDNYLTLMPQEIRTIVTELRVADARGEHPHINVEGFHVTAKAL